MTSKITSSQEVTARSGTQPRAWWKEASVYQIYPASFCDSTGNGTGDLPGIISKMDYIKKLGVDVVWLCPIFASPQIDMGYDISDYKTIDPEYGTIEDVDTLMNGLHERGVKLLLDLVVNHTSDQHEWFKQSKSGKDNPYRDWYVWRKPKYDEEGKRQPPNNWISHFEGSAWEYCEVSDEYYLHLFAKEQPDLNWEHKPVRDAVHEIMRFWLSRGIDGFRLDVINYISKPQDFPDSSQPPDGVLGTEFYCAGPRLHEYLQDIGAILNEYNAFSVGEMPSVQDPNEVIKAVRYDRNELNMIFHFDFMCLDKGPDDKYSPRTWKLSELKAPVAKWQKFMYDNGGWNALYLENHDQPRSVSRFASDSPEYRTQSAKMLATFLAFQAGTVFIYEGQELGMTNVPKEWPLDEYKDISCVNHQKWLKTQTPDEKAWAVAKEEYQKKSRDNARTPMQWTSDASGGFSSSSGPTWMTVNPNTEFVNAASQVDDPSSPFSYWRAVLAARKEYKDSLIYGNFEMLDEIDEKVLAYTREAEDGTTILVLCNFSAEETSWSLKSEVGSAKKVVLSNNGKTLDDFVGRNVALIAYEACAVLLE
ncbi:hypothetical protein V495_04606 [Pseudogymnoascus sp. VKM F-4514 (FW-929)]|nr:hypothetical protein V490_06310 [Pseudogymnoascus sp. VKM F-3557]KFY42303.1 hypothetical protein V495_04606 [Pseudogymnoascus sp. VKM F-4514 (FW-929)]KFY53697.1 hypothetical protein V497_08316 [Pseudogymnoascus sp. VKM F-4516 (FW-969)]